MTWNNQKSNRESQVIFLMIFHSASALSKALGPVEITKWYILDGGGGRGR